MTVKEFDIDSQEEAINIPREDITHPDVTASKIGTVLLIYFREE